MATELKDNKQRIIKEIFAEYGDGSVKDLLSLMDCFETMMDRGYVEQFINNQNEVDYRITHRFTARQIAGKLDLDFSNKPKASKYKILPRKNDYSYFCVGCGFNHTLEYVDCVWRKNV